MSSLHYFLHPAKSPYISQSNLTDFFHLDINLHSHKRRRLSIPPCEISFRFNHKHIGQGCGGGELYFEYTERDVLHTPNPYRITLSKQTNKIQFKAWNKDRWFSYSSCQPELCTSGKGFKDLKFKHMKTHLVQIWRRHFYLDFTTTIL